VVAAKVKYDISQRRACRAIGQSLSTQRYKVKKLLDEDELTNRIINLANQYGRYGTPRITAILKREGFMVNHKRVERIWRQQGLKVAKKQKKRRRLWLNDGSTIRLRPEYKNHVWSYDIMEDKTYNGKKFRILNIIDEYSRECLLSFASRRITSREVVEFLTDLFCRKGLPDYIRSDNGSEFTAKRVREFISNLGTYPAFIEPGSPWENGYIESFNGKMRDELLNGEIFDTMAEARVLIDSWKAYYNTIRPHSSLEYRPPAPETRVVDIGFQMA
jgi:transposase InsO family protein